MKKIRLAVMALICAVFSPAKADEGMWLLQLMQEQNLADQMKARGLNISISDIYNPNQVTLKDAVGIFGGGCTGEIISPDGLILTNHHCGYGAIQQHSSVEHDYLTDGFWAKNRSEELPTPGLTFRFVERIVDITEKVNNDIKKGKITEIESFGQKYLNEIAKKELKNSDLKGKPGISTQALPFYAGNKFYLFFIKTYSDVRMVAAPPSSIGKFGGALFSARFVGESWKDSLYIGALMNTRGLMELVVLTIGYEMKILSPAIFVILSEASFTFFAGTPAYIPGSSTEFARITAPAAMTVPSGITALSITTAPIPMSTSLPIFAPWTTALCPTDTFSPRTVSDTPRVPWSTAPSWTLLPFPMRMAPTSPRSTAPYHMLQSFPMVTSPTSAALSATKVFAPTTGVFPLRVFIIIIFDFPVQF